MPDGPAFEGVALESAKERDRPQRVVLRPRRWRNVCLAQGRLIAGARSLKHRKQIHSSFKGRKNANGTRRFLVRVVIKKSSTSARNDAGPSDRREEEEGRPKPPFPSLYNRCLKQAVCPWAGVALIRQRL